MNRGEFLRIVKAWMRFSGVYVVRVLLRRSEEEDWLWGKVESLYWLRLEMDKGRVEAEVFWQFKRGGETFIRTQCDFTLGEKGLVFSWGEVIPYDDIVDRLASVRRVGDGIAVAGDEKRGEFLRKAEIFSCQPGIIGGDHA